MGELLNIFGILNYDVCPTALNLTKLILFLTILLQLIGTAAMCITSYGVSNSYISGSDRISIDLYRLINAMYHLAVLFATITKSTEKDSSETRTNTQSISKSL